MSKRRKEKTKRAVPPSHPANDTVPLLRMQITASRRILHSAGHQLTLLQNTIAEQNRQSEFPSDNELEILATKVKNLGSTERNAEELARVIGMLERKTIICSQTGPEYIATRLQDILSSLRQALILIQDIHRSDYATDWPDTPARSHQSASHDSFIRRFLPSS